MPGPQELNREAHPRGSLFVRYVGLLSPKGPKASEFVAVLNLEGPSVQSVTVASASRDVLQRVQVPNFDA